MSIYDFKIMKADGTEVSIADYKGMVLLIVNTATGCGFTPQYEPLQELYEELQGKDFELGEAEHVSHDYTLNQPTVCAGTVMMSSLQAISSPKR